MLRHRTFHEASRTLRLGNATLFLRVLVDTRRIVAVRTRTARRTRRAVAARARGFRNGALVGDFRLRATGRFVVGLFHGIKKC